MSSPSSAGSSPRLAPPPPQNETGDAPPPPQDEGEQALDSSFFPSPSHFYKRYTSANLALPPSAFLPPIPGEIEPDSVKREELEPPNVDWVVERGSYAVFGETWPVEEVSPTLEEMGVTEMFNRGEDRTTSLLTLLRTMLVTYTTLISSLLAPPPSITVPQPAEPPDPERLVNHIRLISINMHFLVNELRPGQRIDDEVAIYTAGVSATHTRAQALFGGAITTAAQHVSGGLIAQYGVLTIKTTNGNGEPDESWGPDIAVDATLGNDRHCLLEVSYSQPYSVVLRKTQSLWLPSGLISRVVILDILPRPSPRPPRPPQQDPPVRIVVEQWIMRNGQPTLDDDPLHARFTWREGGPAVATNLNLPLTSFFHPQQAGPPAALPLALQNPHIYFNTLVTVQAADLQAIFTRIAVHHHAR
ncbi:Mediator complex, subunit Med7 [Pseudohyphozyma bogoriensis]|nr:Mediator complex, subunit Med7 [Pseudohyphozyma bogoriensis]